MTRHLGLYLARTMVRSRCTYVVAACRAGAEQIKVTPEAEKR